MGPPLYISFIYNIVQFIHFVPSLYNLLKIFHNLVLVGYFHDDIEKCYHNNSEKKIHLNHNIFHQNVKLYFTSLFITLPSVNFFISFFFVFLFLVRKIIGKNLSFFAYK